MEQQLTRRQRRLLKKQEREKEQTRAGAKRAPIGRIVGIVIAVVVVFGGGYGIWQMGKNAPASITNGAPATTTYTDAPVHWHAAFEVELCGKKQDFSSYGATTHAGSPLLHTHGDGLIHIEGRVIAKEDIAVGKFFDGIDIPFDRDRIMDKKNGDTCKEGGQPGQVKMFVNGQSNNEFRDFVGQYTPEAKDNLIRIVFE